MHQADSNAGFQAACDLRLLLLCSVTCFKLDNGLSYRQCTSRCYVITVLLFVSYLFLHTYAYIKTKTKVWLHKTWQLKM